MKKMGVFLGLLISLMFCCNTGVLADTDYYIEKGDFTVTVPDGYYVLHRDMAEDDPALAFLDSTVQEIEASYFSDDICLELFNADFSTDIQIIVAGVADLDEGVTITLDDDDNDLIEEAKEYIRAGDYDIVDGEESILYSDEGVNVVKGAQVKFIQAFPAQYTNSEKTQQFIENYTIVNGQTITIYSYCSGDEPSQAEIDLINTITESIYFENFSYPKDTADAVSNGVGNSGNGTGATTSDTVMDTVVGFLLILVYAFWFVAIIYAILCTKGKIVPHHKKIPEVIVQYHYGVENSNRWLYFYSKYLLAIWFVVGCIFIIFQCIALKNFWSLFNSLYLIFIIFVYRELKKYSYLGYHFNVIFLWGWTVTGIFNYSLDDNALFNYVDLIAALICCTIFLIFNLSYFRNRKILFTDEQKIVSQDEDHKAPEIDSENNSESAVQLVYDNKLAGNA